MAAHPSRLDRHPGAMGLQVHRSVRADVERRPTTRRCDPYDPAMVLRQSAGILLFRRGDDRAAEPELLLGHPGGPFFARRDEGHWTIPKGEPDGVDGDLLAVARREFTEETGLVPPASQPDGTPPVSLGTIVQKGGKVVHAWAIEGDLDPADAQSNEFEMEWPPRSGRHQTFPELDRVAWFRPDEARRRLKPTQIPFVDRLIEMLAAGEGKHDGS
jgi:predicted NUDIX family NTP pyrophosphohydrolase